MSDICVFRSTNDCDLYSDLANISTYLSNNTNGYASASKRLFLSKYLYAISYKDENIGFISLVKDDRYVSDILLMDLCLLPEYQEMSIGDLAIYELKDDIVKQEDYNNEFIMLDKSKTNDVINYPGVMYDESLMLIDGRIDELNYYYPDGIRKEEDLFLRNRS